jgi:hypothetical protein
VRTEDDVARSLRQFVWRAFEDDVVTYANPNTGEAETRDWEVRLAEAEGEFRWPFAVVQAVTPVDVSGPAVQRDCVQTLAVHVYPVPMATPDESLAEVRRVKEILTLAFEVGFSWVDKPDPLDASTWLTVAAAPKRVPLYDFAGLPLAGPGSQSFTRGASDYLRVSTCPINHLVDPEDDRFWLVIAEPRVSWRRTGRVPSGQVLVQSAQMEYDAE